MADRIRRAPDVPGAAAEEVMGSLREDVALAFKRCNQLERELADAAKLLAERDAELAAQTALVETLRTALVEARSVLVDDHEVDEGAICIRDIDAALVAAGKGE